MEKTYWLQLKAPAGNWYDSIGFFGRKDDALRMAQTKHDKNGEAVRVVERVDTPVKEWVVVP